MVVFWYRAVCIGDARCVIALATMRELQVQAERRHCQLCNHSHDFRVGESGSDEACGEVR